MTTTAILTLASATIYFGVLLFKKRDSVVDAAFSVLIFLILLIWIPCALYFLLASLAILIYEFIMEFKA